MCLKRTQAVGGEVSIILLGSDAASMGNLFPKFCDNMLNSLSRAAVSEKLALYLEILHFHQAASSFLKTTEANRWKVV